MSTFPLMPLPHFSTNEFFRSHIPPHQYQGSNSMSRSTLDPTLGKNSSQERVALPSLNAQSSQVFAPSRKVFASPAVTLPAQSPSIKRVRALTNASKSITLEMLRPHFEKPLAEVANIFGICMTLMKKICRKNGVPRWPHRQIRGLRKSIWSIEKALRCCDSEAQQRSYNDHLQKQRMKLLTILRGPVSPTSKAAFELLLSEPCSPIADLTTPPAVKKALTSTSPPKGSFTPGYQLPMLHLQSRSHFYQAMQAQGKTLSKLPSIASLLTKNEKQPVNMYNYQF